MKTKINSFLTSDTSSSFPHFFRMLDNSYSLKVLKSECSSTWDCNWLLTVYLFLWNLKWSVNHHINIKVSYWSQVSFSKKLSFTVRNICGLFFFYLSGFSFTNIHESLDRRGWGRAFLQLLTTTSTRFTDT